MQIMAYELHPKNTNRLEQDKAHDLLPEPAKRLKEARINAGFRTAKLAAERFGWNKHTYSQHENGTRGYDKQARKYGKAFHVSPAWLTLGEGSPPENSEVKSSLSELYDPVGQVLVSGKVAASSWMSVEDMDFGYEDQIYVPSAHGYPLEWQFALKIEGDCLNKIAADGDILVCVNIIAAQIDIASDDLVIVERRRYEGQMVERTAKRVRRTTDGFELWPESTNPLHQEPIKLFQDVGGEQIEVIGKVLWILRKP